jgi:acyl-CoA synthetase (AMP-forming)/AMP-acid ligase II
VSVVAGIRGEEYRKYPESTGRVNPTVQCEIRDENGNPVPDGVDGEIHVRSAYNLLEYWGNPEATAQAFKPGRWLATGDIGRFEDGLLYINSRARDMILVNAENVYPIEIEHRLDSHPSVRESAVVGVDDSETGQAIKAIVVIEPGTQPQEDELAAWVGETLAGYKVPAHWALRDEPLPRNPSGKVLKNVLTGEAESTFVAED